MNYYLITIFINREKVMIFFRNLRQAKEHVGNNSTSIFGMKASDLRHREVKSKSKCVIGLCMAAQHTSH